MKVFKFAPPYNKNGKANFPLRDKAGIYIVKEAGVIVYIGKSRNNLYRTMYRRFEKWEEPNLSFDLAKKYTVRVIYCTDKQADSLEKKLILKYEPKHNLNQYKEFQENTYDKQVFNAYMNTEPVPF